MNLFPLFSVLVYLYAFTLTLSAQDSNYYNVLIDKGNVVKQVDVNNASIYLNNCQIESISFKHSLIDLKYSKDSNFYSFRNPYDTDIIIEIKDTMLRIKSANTEFDSLVTILNVLTKTDTMINSINTLTQNKLIVGVSNTNNSVFIHIRWGLVTIELHYSQSLNYLIGFNIYDNEQLELANINCGIDQTIQTLLLITSKYDIIGSYIGIGSFNSKNGIGAYVYSFGNNNKPITVDKTIFHTKTNLKLNRSFRNKSNIYSIDNVTFKRE